MSFQSPQKGTKGHKITEKSLLELFKYNVFKKSTFDTKKKRLEGTSGLKKLYY